MQSWKSDILLPHDLYHLYSSIHKNTNILLSGQFSNFIFNEWSSSKLEFPRGHFKAPKSSKMLLKKRVPNSRKFRKGCWLPPFSGWVTMLTIKLKALRSPAVHCSANTYVLTMCKALEAKWWQVSYLDGADIFLYVGDSKLLPIYTVEHILFVSPTTPHGDTLWETLFQTLHWQYFLIFPESFL